jgi:SAM-dependent methyltransferase
MNISKFNRSIEQEILLKYAKGSKWLLDIGAGIGTSLGLYHKAGVKNVYGIEPSVYSIQRAADTINNLKKDLNIVFQHGQGDIDWSTDPTYKAALAIKFDTINFMFTLHYMLNNIDIVFKNINSVSKKGTKVIVHCIDGEKVLNTMNQDKGKYEIVHNQDVIWGVYKYNDPLPRLLSNGKLVKCLFYFKGVYGLNTGSEEYLVDVKWLIDQFSKNGFTCVQNENFASFVKSKSLIKYPFQKEIISNMVSLVFSKK